MRPEPSPPNGTRDAISVLVVDDDPLVRGELAAALGAVAQVRIAGQAEDGAAVLAAVEISAPDVVLMDVEMPLLDGVRASWRLSATRPEVPVVLMTAEPFDELVLLALRAGAAGVVPKGLGVEVLGRVLRGVAGDEGSVSRQTSRLMSEELHRRREHAREMRPIDSPLTTREWQVLHLMAAGASTAAMSQELFLSVHTVRSHVKRVLTKLGVHSRAEAVTWAEQQPDSPGGPRTVDPADQERALALALEAVLRSNQAS